MLEPALRSLTRPEDKGLAARPRRRRVRRPNAGEDGGSSEALATARSLVVLCAAFFMVILDTTIVNVALPSIGAGLRSPVTGLQWVVDAYTLVFAVLLLGAGWGCDRLGARRVFLVGLGAFTAGSGLCALAPGIHLLVGARVVQGAGAALVLPASLAVIASVFSDPKARARAIGVWAAVAGAATALGPVAGGLLVDLAGWRSIFLVNLPIGVAALAMGRRQLCETQRRPGGFDPGGQALAAGALALVTFGLIEAGSAGWASTVVIAAVGVGIALGGAFVALESRVAHPMLPTGLFHSPVFSAANVVGLVLNFGIYGQVFVLSLYFQRARGYSPLATGLALLPFAAMTVAGPVGVGRLTAKVGARLPMVAGQLFAAAGSALLAMAGAHTPYGSLAPGLVALGTGMALVMPSMTAAVVQAAPGGQAGVASGVLNTARQVGGAIGVALLGSLVAGAGHLVSGMHLGLGVVAVVFALGALVAWRYTKQPRPAATRPDGGQDRTR